ncbi:hypothetical protein BBJ29_003270 [Phytophthora kernoviae]|uniref:Uncharacterized protein n=1 Tax=Phytophthora kernoviae TaxID=325452 RepID=A0A3F2RYR7_9STRA|nr:hypothetical protein BBJ29_003270 [Phytophthora kernoviae]RLN66913.1 hypothetical protein BBP00_00001929 [Phytophthora kernoviae]
MLTSADLEEIKEDIHFFLDEFGSTGAVRRKLQAQLKEIERLGFTVRRLQGRRDKAQEPKDENTEESEEKDAMDEVDRIQADVEFFLKAFGSTRVSDEKFSLVKPTQVQYQGL